MANRVIGICIIAVCFLAAVDCLCSGTAKSFSAMSDTSVLLNPERGFYHTAEITTSSYTPIDLADLQQIVSNERISILFVQFVMNNFVSSNISQTVLGYMATDFQTVRSAGMKTVVRFSYTVTEGNMNDAALTQLLKHIDQIKPLLQNNADIIMAVQVGLVGTWGEWYYSSHYSTPMDGGSWYGPTSSQQTSRNTIVDALLNALPKSRMVQLRTPSYKQAMCGAASLPPSQAFNATNNCARIGIHNDCFMASGQDMGTFESDAQRTWLTNEGLYVMVGGESCQSNTQTGCTGGIDQIAKQRFTYLNVEYHGTVIQGWKTGACFNTISNMMGYRFQLVSGTFPSSVTRGASYCGTINLKNTGVAPVYNARPVQVILRNKSTLALTTFAQPAVDPRRWAPGSTVAIDLSFVVPSTQAVGTYDVLLNLPDGSSSLANIASYRILLANSNGVQEASTRYNLLAQVTVQ